MVCFVRCRDCGKTYFSHDDRDRCPYCDSSWSKSIDNPLFKICRNCERPFIAQYEYDDCPFCESDPGRSHIDYPHFKKCSNCEKNFITINEYGDCPFCGEQSRYKDIDDNTPEPEDSFDDVEESDYSYSDDSNDSVSSYSYSSSASHSDSPGLLKLISIGIATLISKIAKKIADSRRARKKS